MKTYLADNHISFLQHSERKSQIVKSLNWTINGIMFRYLMKKNTWRYIDILQGIVSKYNVSDNRSIKMDLKDVSKNKETQV